MKLKRSLEKLEHRLERLITLSCIRHLKLVVWFLDIKDQEQVIRDPEQEEQEEHKTSSVEPQGTQ